MKYLSLIKHMDMVDFCKISPLHLRALGLSLTNSAFLCINNASYGP
jgi:hypothetical protein